MECLRQFVRSGIPEALVRAPSASGETLLNDEAEAVPRSIEMLDTVVRQVGLHGRAQRIDVAVSMLTRKHIAIFRKRTKIRVVLKETLRQLPIAGARATLIAKI